MKNEPSPFKILAKNKKAYFEYFVEDKIEAGIALVGTEVKSIRAGHFTMNDGYARISEHMEVWLHNFSIAEYKNSGYAHHEAGRPKRLLLNKSEIRKLYRKVNISGYTLIPLSVYLKNNLIKVELGLCRGKKQYDKRETIKQRDLDRDMERKIRR